ncbi:MAG: hypothetical protein AAFO29_07430, partial [Actinomycetota bacterium]
MPKRVASRFNPRSVRFRTTAGAALALLVLLALSGVVVILLVAREVRQAADNTLLERAEDRAVLLAAGNPPEALTQVVGDEVVIAVFDADGAVLAVSGTDDPSGLLELTDGVGTVELIVDENESGDGNDGEVEAPHSEELRASLQTLADGRRVAVASEDEQTRQTISTVSAVLIV